ncbi:helix-turn-helix domain-containing protein [Micromonospora sp. ALFpr18c]|uniref:helix-turn-helix domain-containing protein n=1 Tax=unclassified Micromonospora TaxID=2617518 RepID=UPI00124B22C2|nr:helix-turn-helix domain-containing protein [Micromonospora sp. ALFpr18c]KAB1933434.1 helix-turn-helix domain-containing protein [Micromonospora sp. ALFpr18c]
MTRPLAGGWLLVAPDDACRLAQLVRAGALTFRHRRNLTTGEGALLMVVEQAAYAARSSAAGTVAVLPEPGRSPSTVTASAAARALRVSDSYIRRLCRTGALEAQRSGTEWHIDADSLAAYALTRGERQHEHLPGTVEPR